MPATETIEPVDKQPAAGPAGGAAAGMPFANEQELAQIRDQCRALAVGNEFAINGHKNRISYIVGGWARIYRRTSFDSSRTVRARGCWSSSFSSSRR
jgi:hypothetical protein